MLREAVREHEPQYLTTYTRNPAIVRMMESVVGGTYPIISNDKLKQIAQHMEGATVFDGAVYHINRYDESGLFKGEDPAGRQYEGRPFYDHFSGLQCARNALIIVSDARRGML